MKILKYKRICRYCEVCFETLSKYGKVCDRCRAENHTKKIMRTIFKKNKRTTDRKNLQKR